MAMKKHKFTPHKEKRVEFMVRLPPDVCAWLDRRAKEDHRSRNSLMEFCLRGAMIMDEAASKKELTPLFDQVQSIGDRIVQSMVETMQRSDQAKQLLASIIAEQGRKK